METKASVENDEKHNTTIPTACFVHRSSLMTRLCIYTVTARKTVASMYASMYDCYHPIHQHHQFDGHFPLKTVRPKMGSRSPARPSRKCMHPSRATRGIPPRPRPCRHTARSTYAPDCTGTARTSCRSRPGPHAELENVIISRARTLHQVDLHACVSRTCTCADVQCTEVAKWEIEEHRNLTQMGRHANKTRRASPSKPCGRSLSFVSFPSVSVAWWVRP